MAMSIIKDFFRSIGLGFLHFSKRFEKGPVYTPDSDTSFAYGATQAKAVLQNRKVCALRLYDWAREKREPQYELAIKEAREAGIPIVHSDTPIPAGQFVLHRYSVSLEFEKWEDRILPGSHVVLVDPVYFINSGTIMRSALAFGIHDIAIITENECDTFDPSLLRCSMGTRLNLRVEVFRSIEEYIARFPDNHRYAFMLNDTATRLGGLEAQKPYSLIFGTESLGLPEEYSEFCQPVFIEQSDELDSLNMSVAAGIVLYKLSGADHAVT